MAAVISTHIGYLLLTFLPPIIWLVFYLREDRHPEPKLLLLLTFAGGMGAAVAAVVAECAFVQLLSGSSCQDGLASNLNPFVIFIGIALIEEYLKYASVKLLILKRKDFDEPVDAMIYLMTAALGFAALENALFIFPLFRDSLFVGLEVTANRFLGANLLHALSSGIVGFFLARTWFHPRRRHFVALGIGIATLLHMIFNYLILIREVVAQGTFYLTSLLILMAIMVFIDFERLKAPPIKTTPPSPDL